MDIDTAQYSARLWLQTDAALGMREVPLVLPKSAPVTVAKTNPAAANTGRTAPRPPYAPTAQPPVSRVPPRPPAAAAPPAWMPTAAASSGSSSTVTASGQGVAIPRALKLPPIPAERLDQLPPISAADKPRLLAELQQQTIAALTPWISNIATRVVFGDGDPAAALMFVGEGPGIEEDKTGIPFVGKSGQLLNKMIAAMGLSRQTVYIGNVVKLRSAEPDPDTGRLRDRPPTFDEVALNIPWLHRQIEIIRPRVIVTLGAPALKYLSGTTESVGRLRGTWLEYRGVPLMPTYHPSFLLRAYTPENRAKVWSDLQQVMARLGLSSPQ
jgi:DNA polymerase